MANAEQLHARAITTLAKKGRADGFVLELRPVRPGRRPRRWRDRSPPA
jgi:hypothetical protein